MYVSMARRKEVFQSKVLQKLYPAAPTVKKEPSPPSIVDALSKKTYVKRKPPQQDTAIGDSETAQNAATSGRRMYTVLPPPADHKTDSEKSISLPQSESINSAEDPAEEDLHDSNEDQDKEEEEHKMKRRRRKKKPTPQQDFGKDGAAAASESSPGQSQTPVDEGGEPISRNKKRKLKKKRHKEKLLSMGLMPRAAALEFTYQKDGEQEEEDDDDDERRAAEVSDFLRTTLEIYMSDASSRADKLPSLSAAVDDLLSSISSGCKPSSVLQRLYRLKALVQQRETDKLEEALEELCDTSPMSAEETTAVVSLFKYWITDVFPMQGDKATALSAPMRQQLC